MKLILRYFNSSMVRLGVLAVDQHRLALCFISIPVWCDWENYPNQHRRFSCQISIPVWCDWENPSIFVYFAQICNFNSSMVRLGVRRSISVNSALRYFNSSMVRLGARSSSHSNELSTNFNSSMVRLGELCTDFMQEVFSYFNSSMVRLGVLYQLSQDVAFRHFNSSMVRLGAPKFTYNEINWSKFQFQYGAIGRQTLNTSRTNSM